MDVKMLCKIGIYHIAFYGLLSIYTQYLLWHFQQGKIMTQDPKFNKLRMVLEN